MPPKKKNEKSGPSPNPLDILSWFHGLDVPDIITFITSPDYLNRNDLYPRQATILKCIFLQTELFTQYDRDVIDEWTEEYSRGGNNGIQPDIYERIEWCKQDGRKWFREVVNVSGRRGGKGYIGALAMAYVLWNYMATGDPQDHYGIDKSKKLVGLIFAGKLSQAKENLWRDLVNVIMEAPCFQPYIVAPQAEKLSIYAPKDFKRMRDMTTRGIDTSKLNMATFEIIPKESTLMAGRGVASFCLDPETPVLTAELNWVPIKDLQVGQKIVGIDEFAGKGQHRRLREVEVRGVWKTRKPATRLIFEDGSDLICSEDHKWLVRDKGTGGFRKWRKTKSLTVGSSVCHLVDPWNEMSGRDAGYLAGVYDGEGCIVETASVRGSEILFTQNPGAVLEQTLSLLRRHGFDPQPCNPGAYLRDGTCEEWALRGVAECMRFIAQTQPVRLFPKHRRLWKDLTPRGGITPNGRVRPDSYKKISEIEYLPYQELIDIETSSHTFIANGFISHNCQAFDEMAHVVASGANRSAEEVYVSSVPSLDQFGKDGFIYEPSSPWQMMGQFYENYINSTARETVEWDEDGNPTKDVPMYPNIMMIQLTSWNPYEDWQRAHLIPMFPGENAPHFTPKKKAVQAVRHGHAETRTS